MGTIQDQVKIRLSDMPPNDQPTTTLDERAVQTRDVGGHVVTGDGNVINICYVKDRLAEANGDDLTAVDATRQPHLYVSFSGTQDQYRPLLNRIGEIARKNRFELIFAGDSENAKDWRSLVIYGLGHCHRAVILVDRQTSQTPSLEVVAAWWLMSIDPIFRCCIVCLDDESYDHLNSVPWGDFNFTHSRNTPILCWGQQQAEIALDAWLAEASDGELEAQTVFESIENAISEKFRDRLPDPQRIKDILPRINRNFRDAPHHTKKTIYHRLVRLLLYKGFAGFNLFFTHASDADLIDLKEDALGGILERISTTWIPIEAAAKIPAKIYISNETSLALALNCDDPKTVDWYLDLAYFPRNRLGKQKRSVHITSTSIDDALTDLKAELGKMILNRSQRARCNTPKKLAKAINRKLKGLMEEGKSVFAVWPFAETDVPDRQFLEAIYQQYPYLVVLVLTGVECDHVAGVPYIDLITPPLEEDQEMTAHDHYDECLELIEECFSD